MKKTLLAFICLSFAFTSWSQRNSDILFSYDLGVGISTEEVKDITESSSSIVQTFSAHLPLMKVHNNTSALLGLQFTHANLTHDDKYSPADFGEVTHDLATNTSLLAPSLRFQTSLGKFYPYVEASAGLMTQRSNIVTTVDNGNSSIFECSNSDVTTTKINDMQTQFGLQSAVGVSYGEDNWRFNLSVNYLKGTRSFLMPTKSLDKGSFNFDDVGEHYDWKSVRPEIMNIKLGVTFVL